MPLYKRKPFALIEPPRDLDPHESVFQVRFTKEIFRDYQEYLKRLNLYRERVWTCKATGKTNLTYEEALVSEHRASEKAQNFPKELVGLVLSMIQYSTLIFGELVNKIWVRFQEELFVGLELHAKKDGSLFACKILKIITTDGKSTNYEIGWMDRDKKVINTSIVSAEDLVQKRPPLSRNMVRLFIRESSSQSTPWLIHDELAKKYGISTNPPEGLKDKLARCVNKRAYRDGTMENGNSESKRRKGAIEKGAISSEEKSNESVRRYPIEDLLVQPASDDPIFTKQPTPCKDFRVSMDCVGDLLAIWDFCSSFGKLLHLSPFSLTDFESAVCHKESNLALIVEVHSAIFHLLIKEDSGYFAKARKSKITLINWTEYLCDFMESENRAVNLNFSSYLATVKRGHYGLLDTEVKLRVLRELVEEALTTSVIRAELEERIERQQMLKSTKREEERKKKEEQEQEERDKDNKEKGGERKRPTDDGQQMEREIEKLSIRTNSLGKDRYHNRFWFFRREGRLFFESVDSKDWGYYSTKDELDMLMGSLNPKGVRERALKRQLEKFYNRISTALEKRTKDVAQKILLEEAVLRRSTRVRAQPRENPAMSFLKYFNKWKET